MCVIQAVQRGRSPWQHSWTWTTTAAKETYRRHKAVRRPDEFLFGTCRISRSRVRNKCTSSSLCSSRAATAAMPAGPEQIRQLLLDFGSDDEVYADESAAASPTQPRAVGTNSSSSVANSNSSSRGRAAAQSKAAPSRRSRDVDARMLFLKRVHGGTFPAFDDSKPDPGCAYELAHYRRVADPTYTHGPRNFSVGDTQLRCQSFSAACCASVRHAIVANPAILHTSTVASLDQASAA